MIPMVNSHNMRKVLIIAYDFPPVANIAALRIGKFAKYLPQFGWEPIILTAVSTKGKPQSMFGKIKNLNILRTHSFTFASIVSHLTGTREKTLFQLQHTTSRYKNMLHLLLSLVKPFCKLPIIEGLITDPVGWFLSARKEGLEAVTKRNVDIIFSSSNPPTAHFIASYLHRKTGVPWIAEFRDPWVDPYDEKGKLYELIERGLERVILKKACLLIAVSKPQAELIENIHCKRTLVITNGFDEEDYLESIPLASKFTITYTGNIYPGKRDPSLLFTALCELKKEGKISSQDIQVHFFGGSALKSFVPMIHEYHLEGIVKVYNKIPFKECLKRQKESTVLLLLEWDNPRAIGVYSGKLFEYMGAARPILAIGYKTGVIDELLVETGTGVLVNDAEAIKTILYRWLKEFKEKGNITSFFNPRANKIAFYSRREQTRRLASQLYEITPGP